jgi:hypothetical protein
MRSGVQLTCTAVQLLHCTVVHNLCHKMHGPSLFLLRPACSLSCSVPVKLEMRSYFLSYLDRCSQIVAHRMNHHLTCAIQAGSVSSWPPYTSHALCLPAAGVQHWSPSSSPAWCSCCAAPRSCAGLMTMPSATLWTMRSSFSRRSAHALKLEQAAVDAWHDTALQLLNRAQN